MDITSVNGEHVFISDKQFKRMTNKDVHINSTKKISMHTYIEQVDVCHYHLYCLTVAEGTDLYLMTETL